MPWRRRERALDRRAGPQVDLPVGQRPRGALHRSHRDGRLHVDGRVIILAEPVRERLHAYLDLRQQRWPEAANAHLFLTKHTGRRTEECSKRWIWLTIGPDLSIAAIREDRILDEARATGGDVRRLADLFGLSIQAGSRYTNVISYPDLGSTSRP